MSTLLVSRITTESNTTYLTLTTGNTLSGSIVIQTANSDITINGTLKGDGAKLTNIQSDVANGAYAVTNSAFGFANGVSTNTTAAFERSNTIYAAVNSAFAVINAAYTTANAAYTAANSAATTGKAIAMAIVFGG